MKKTKKHQLTFTKEIQYIKAVRAEKVNEIKVQRALKTEEVINKADLIISDPYYLIDKESIAQLKKFRRTYIIAIVVIILVLIITFGVVGYLFTTFLRI